MRPGVPTAALVLGVLAAALVLGVLASRSEAGQNIEGVWKPVEAVVAGGPDAGRHMNDVQPGMLVFTRRHYSMTFVTSREPRSLLGAGATDAERVRAWTAFVGNAGEYALRDSTIAFSPIVAKNPEGMTGRTAELQVRVRADSLWLGNLPSGDGTATIKWVRVEGPSTR